MNFNFSIMNLNRLSISIKPGVIQLRKTNLVVKNFNNNLSTNLRIYNIYLCAQITAYSKQFRTDDVTSNLQEKKKTLNCCNLNTIVERQSSMYKITGLILTQVT